MAVRLYPSFTDAFTRALTLPSVGVPGGAPPVGVGSVLKRWYMPFTAAPSAVEDLNSYGVPGTGPPVGPFNAGWAVNINAMLPRI